MASPASPPKPRWSTWPARAWTGVVEALPIGLALCLGYFLQWVWVLAFRGPLPPALLAPATVLQFLLAAGALYVWLARPAAVAGWFKAAPFAVLAFAAWLLAWALPQQSVTTLAMHPVLLVIAVPYLVVVLLLVSLLLAYPAAGTVRGALGAFIRTGWTVRIGSAALTFLLAAGWLQVAALLPPALDRLIPFPSFSAFMFGLIQAAAWAAVFGAGLTGLRSRVISAGSPERSLVRPSAVQLVSAGLAGAALLASAAISSNLVLVAPMTASVLHLQVSSDLALRALPLATLRQAGDGLGDTYAAEALMAAMQGRRAAADTAARQGVWWAPADTAALRTQGWLAVLGSDATAARAGVLSVRTAGDDPGADQLSGIWLLRNHRDGRPYLFRALEHEQLVSLQLPAGMPPPGPGGLDGQERIVSRVRDGELTALTNLVTELAGRPSYSAALATDQTIRNLMAGSPGQHLAPPYDEDVIAAYSYAMAGDVADAEAILFRQFDSQTDVARRIRVATISLRLAAGGYTVDDPHLAQIEAFAASRGDDEARLAAAVYVLKLGDQDQALQLGQALAGSARDRSAKAWALAVVADVQYQKTDYAAAAQTATESLQLGDKGAAAMDDAIIGNCKLNLAYPKVDASAEQDILAAAHSNPHAFMLWHTLSEIEAQQHHWRAAIDYDVQALNALEVLTSSGLGTYSVVISTPPNHGNFYSLSSGYGYDGFVRTISSEIQELSKETP